MIKEQIERIPYTVQKVVRYPDNILLIQQGNKIVGNITIKNDFEENLWKEATDWINGHLQRLSENKT